MPDRYLADDAEARLRLASAPPCRECVHLVTRTSLVDDAPVVRCGWLDEQGGERMTAAVALLLRAEAQRMGRCDFFAALGADG